MKKYLQTFKTVILALVLSLGTSYVAAWTAPTATPPTGNTSAPLNVGSTSQTKSGALNIATGAISADTQLGSFSAPGSTAGVGYTSFGGGFVGWDYANSGIALNAHSAGGSIGGLFVKRVDNGHSNVGIGTINPSSRLAVSGDVSIGSVPNYGMLNVGVPGSGLAGVNIITPAGNTHLPWADNWNYISGNGVHFRDTANATTVTVNASNGRVYANDYYSAVAGKWMSEIGAGNAGCGWGGHGAVRESYYGERSGNHYYWRETCVNGVTVGATRVMWY